MPDMICFPSVMGPRWLPDTRKVQLQHLILKTCFLEHLWYPLSLVPQETEREAMITYLHFIEGYSPRTRKIKGKRK